MAPVLAGRGQGGDRGAGAPKTALIRSGRSLSRRSVTGPGKWSGGPPARSRPASGGNARLVKDSFAFTPASSTDLIRKFHGEMLSCWCRGRPPGGAGRWRISRAPDQMNKAPFDTLNRSLERGAAGLEANEPGTGARSDLSPRSRRLDPVAASDCDGKDTTILDRFGRPWRPAVAIRSAQRFRGGNENGTFSDFIEEVGAVQRAGSGDRGKRSQGNDQRQHSLHNGCPRLR